MSWIGVSMGNRICSSAAREVRISRRGQVWEFTNCVTVSQDKVVFGEIRLFSVFHGSVSWQTGISCAVKAYFTASRSRWVKEALRGRR